MPNRYRCRECGNESEHEGLIHAHIDAKHHGIGPFNLLMNPFAVGDAERLNAKTEVVDAR